MPDPRGRIHPLPGLLAIAAAAVAAGQSTVTEIAEWAGDLPDTVLTRLGAARDPFTGVRLVPDDSTFARVLAALDADALDTAICQWLITRQTGDPVPGWRAIAVDGKTLRGSGQPGAQVHLLAAIDQRTGVVLAQTDVDGKTNEIARFVPLLTPVDLTGVVVTADALHTQHGHARWLVETKKAGYVFTVKRNHPRLYRQLEALPWTKIPVLDETHHRGHDVRRLQAVTCTGALRLDFPHAVQALRIRRRRYNPATGRWSTVTVYAITNLTASQASPPTWPTGYAVTGPSRSCTTSETPPTAKTPSASVPATHPAPWPPCATPRSACSAWPALPPSPKPYATTAANHIDPYNSSESPEKVI